MGRPRKNPLPESTETTENVVKSGMKCEGCGKPIDAYVVAGGKRYCSDKCVKENL